MLQYKGPQLRSGKDFKKPSIKTQKYGEKSLEYFGTLLWNLLPKDIREADCANKFKMMIKYWKPIKCPCYLCKDFVKGIGLVETCNNCKSCN